jgi:hypothetical protein
MRPDRQSPLPGAKKSNNAQFHDDGVVVPESSEHERLLTVEDVAQRLRVRTTWVYRHADDLGVFRLGKYLRFSWPIVMERLKTLRR